MGIYKRELATGYAERWALSRNPRYYDFDPLGGDCTNFISQCLYAGCGVMNYTKTFGWYYKNLNDRSPAWTGVGELYKFLTSNKGSGPQAKLCELGEAEVGDILQLGTMDGRFYHSLIIMRAPPEVLVAAHTDNALFRHLSSYSFENIRALHIFNIG